MIKIKQDQRKILSVDYSCPGELPNGRKFEILYHWSDSTGITVYDVIFEGQKAYTEYSDLENLKIQIVDLFMEEMHK